MSPINYNPMYLTVNANGLCSLWDRKEQAEAVTDETMVVLTPTTAQLEQIIKAKQASQAKAQRRK